MPNSSDNFVTTFFHNFTAKLAEVSESAKESSNFSTNPGNNLEKLLSSKNVGEDYENTQFSIEEATEGLFSFNHAKTNGKKTSKMLEISSS